MILNCDSVKSGLKAARDHLTHAYEHLKAIVDEHDPLHKPIFQRIAQAKAAVSAQIDALTSTTLDAQAKSRTKAVLGEVLECIDYVEAYGDD